LEKISLSKRRNTVERIAWPWALHTATRYGQSGVLTRSSTLKEHSRKGQNLHAAGTECSSLVRDHKTCKGLDGQRVANTTRGDVGDAWGNHAPYLANPHAHCVGELFPCLGMSLRCPCTGTRQARALSYKSKIQQALVPRALCRVMSRPCIHCWTRDVTGSPSQFGPCPHGLIVGSQNSWYLLGSYLPFALPLE